MIDVLRVQPGENLTEILYTPATLEQEEEHAMSVRKRVQENYTTDLMLVAVQTVGIFHHVHNATCKGKVHTIIWI